MPGVIKDRVYIPLEDFNLDLLPKFEIEMFDEMACRGCPYTKDKPNDYCQNCQAYQGNLKLWKKYRIKDKDYIAIPSANLKRISKITGIDFSNYKDIRTEIPFKYPLKWIGHLREGEVVNDVKSANQKEIVEKWLNPDKRYGFIQAPPRTGKCLCGETLINTEDGFLYLEELELPEGLSIYSKKISSLNGFEQSSFGYKTKSKTIKIKTHKGIEIEGTPEHPLLVLNKDLTFSWKCLQDIEIGNCIIGKPSKAQCLFGKNTSIKKEEATLLGYYLANGGGNSISSGDPLVQNKIMNSIKKLGYPYRIGKQSGIVKDYHIKGGFYNRFLELGYKSKAKNKELGKQVRMSSKDILKEVLTAYFECDSATNGSFLQLCSASEKLMNQIQFILKQAFDIQSEKYKCMKSAANSKRPIIRPYYGLTITGVDAYKFCQEFPTSKVARHYRNKYLRNWYNPQECKNKKFIPFVYDYFKELFKKTLIDKTKENGKHYFIESKYKGFFKLPFPNWKGTSNLLLCHINKWNEWNENYLKNIDKTSYEKLKRILNFSNDYQIITEKIFKEDLVPVYDLEVPGSHSFIANGLTSHNSVIAVNISCTLGLKTLFIAHQEELLENFYKSWLRDTNLEELRAKYNKPIVDIIRKKSDFEDLDVALVTYQKFIRDASKEDIQKYIKGKFGLAIVDEAHQSGAVAYSRFMAELDCRYKLGMSATPMRKDVMNMVLLNVIGPVTVKSEAVGLIPRIEILETGVHIESSYFWTKTLGRLWANENRNKLILKEVVKDLKDHKCIIIPVQTKMHMKCLVDSINNHFGYEVAVGYHRATPNRKSLFKEIDDGKYRVVVAIMSMIKQGIDLLSPSMIYFQIPMSANKLAGAPMAYQMGNRVCTPYPGKREPVIKIFLDNIDESKGCFQSLFLKEILPGLKAPENGRPKYKINQATYDFAFKIIKQFKNKEYDQGGPYNPESGLQRPKTKKDQGDLFLGW